MKYNWTYETVCKFYNDSLFLTIHERVSFLLSITESIEIERYIFVFFIIKKNEMYFSFDELHRTILVFHMKSVIWMVT
jgi:hypothetical protein